MTNRAPEELILSLVHEDPLVRSYTARLLGLDAEAGEVEQYLKSTLVQGTAPLRRAAARAMGELVADWTLEPLSAALDDADPAVRAEAAASLGRLGDATAVPNGCRSTFALGPELRAMAGLLPRPGDGELQLVGQNPAVSGADGSPGGAVLDTC